MSPWRYVGLVLLSLVLLPAVLIGFAPTWLRLGLSLYGVDDITFQSLDVGLNKTELTNLRLGDPTSQAVDRIGLDYTLSGIINGRVDRITVDGLNVQAALDDLIADDAEQTPVVIPAGTFVEELILENGRIDLSTPAGLLSIPLAGHLRTVDDQFAFELAAEEASLGGISQGLRADLALKGMLSLDAAPTLESVTASGELSVQANDASIPDLAERLEGDGLLTFNLENGKLIASIDLNALSWSGADLRSGKARLTIDGIRDALRGRLTLDLEGFSWSDATYAVSDATLEQELDLTFDGQVLDLSVAEKGRISIDQVAAADQAESGWFTIRLHPDEMPLFSFNIDDGGWRSKLAAEIDPVRLETTSGQWWARIENLAIAATGDLEGPEDVKVALKQGRADLPSANLALTGIESDVRLTEQGMSAERSVSIVIRAIRPLDEPRWFNPLRLDVTVQPSPQELPFNGRLTTGKKPGAMIDFSGAHQIESGEGGLTFDLPELIFDPSGLEPADLSPALQDALSDTAGRIRLTGRIDWDQDGLASAADLAIEELGLSIGPARLERVNALLHFDSLSPLTMPAGQELAIGLLDVGMPLTDGLVSMQLDERGEMAVDRLTWRLAGGKIRARPFSFGSDVQALTMLLDVEQLDLDELLGLTQLDGLSGEGLIDGALPLTISETGVIIADGKLEATGKGVLRYRPDQKPGVLQAGGESVGLMLRALENFRYDELNITLDGRTDGETNIGLHVSGANPDLYEGHPIEFNLDLEGDLANLVQTNLSNYRIPDRIREQLQGFGE